MAQNLQTGDTVKVISGAHKGETAKIVAMDRKNNRAKLEGIGEVERHYRKSFARPQGGKATVHQSIDLSNLRLEKKVDLTKKTTAKKAKKEKK